MNPWLDGLIALTRHAPAALAFLLLIAWGILVLRKTLTRLFGETFAAAELLSISAAGWIIPALCLALFAPGISIVFDSPTGEIAALIVILISALKSIGRTSASALALSLILIPSILLRFAFLRDLTLPSYFDSAEHYRIIQTLVLSYERPASLEWTGGLYHLGYHILSAFIVRCLRVETLELMLVSGPLLLAILPFAFFFIVRRETGSNPAALFACLLAGFGFHMPAHLMNWGKYPALLSLFPMLFAFDLAYIGLRAAVENRKALLLPLALAISASLLVHSRALIVFSAAAIAAIAANGWARLQTPYRVAGGIFTAALTLITIFALQNTPAFAPLLAGYLKSDAWILTLILLLAVFAAARFPNAVIFLATWLVLCIVCLYIPIALPALGTQTLLDRPFLQMFAFIPLSLMGGFGLAGLTQTIQRLTPNRNLIQRFITILLFGLVLLNAARNYKFYPSDCCRFASRDDLAALAWMDEHLPPDTKILIASTPLSVTSYESPNAQSGVDAGVWIAPLLQQKTEFAGRTIQFQTEAGRQDLCSRNISAVYIGGMPQSFDANQLDSRPDWYSPALLLPQAKVYRVIGCR